jgi:hypothetical protein
MVLGPFENLANFERTPYGRVAAAHVDCCVLCVLCCGVSGLLATNNTIPTLQKVNIGSVSAKIEYCVKSILRTCLYIKSILHEIVTM